MARPPDLAPAPDTIWVLMHVRPCRCGGGSTMPPHPSAQLRPAQAREDVDTEAPVDLVREALACLHALMIAVLRMRMQQNQGPPLLFWARGLLQGLRQYPFQQLEGPLPPHPRDWRA